VLVNCIIMTFTYLRYVEDVLLTYLTLNWTSGDEIKRPSQEAQQVDYIMF